MCVCVQCGCVCMDMRWCACEYMTSMCMYTSVRILRCRVIAEYLPMLYNYCNNWCYTFSSFSSQIPHTIKVFVSLFLCVCVFINIFLFIDS